MDQYEEAPWLSRDETRQLFLEVDMDDWHGVAHSEEAVKTFMSTLWSMFV